MTSWSGCEMSVALSSVRLTSDLCLHYTAHVNKLLAYSPSIPSQEVLWDAQRFTAITSINIIKTAWFITVLVLWVSFVIVQNRYLQFLTKSDFRFVVVVVVVVLFKLLSLVSARKHDTSNKNKDKNVKFGIIYCPHIEAFRNSDKSNVKMTVTLNSFLFTANSPTAK